MPTTEDPPPPRRQIDWPAAALAVVTTAARGWAAWQRFGPPPPPEPPVPGAWPPPLRLLDPADGEPVLLMGRGKVVWVTFWSAASGSAAAELARLDRAWAGLRGRRRFLAVAAAVDADRPGRLAGVRAAARAGRPVYLATPGTRRAFGVAGAPLHLLIDESGRVAAVARGWGEATLDRLARQAGAALEGSEPAGDARLAGPIPPDRPSRIRGFLVQSRRGGPAPGRPRTAHVPDAPPPVDPPAPPPEICRLGFESANS